MSPIETEADQWRKLLGLSEVAGSMTICRAFERLADALAPQDLSGLPFYAMPTSALPSEFAAASKNTRGWFSEHAYGFLRAHLPHDRGPGPTVVVHDLGLQAGVENSARIVTEYYAALGDHSVTLEELLAYAPRADAIEFVCGALTHEFAHAINSIASGQWAELNDLFEGELSQRVLRRIVARKEIEVEPPPPQIDAHDLRFTRTLAHLDARLRTVGVFSTHLGKSCAGGRFNQAPYDQCVAALADEPARYRQLSFQEIISQPMPEKFAACALELVANGTQ